MLTLPPIKQEVVQLREQQLRAHCVVILIPWHLAGDHFTVVGILLSPLVPVPAIDRRQQRRDDWIIEWIKASRRLGNRVNQGIETIVQSTLPRHRDDWVIELTNVNSIT